MNDDPGVWMSVLTNKLGERQLKTVKKQMPAEWYTEWLRVRRLNNGSGANV